MVICDKQNTILAALQLDTSCSNAVGLGGKSATSGFRSSKTWSMLFAISGNSAACLIIRARNGIAMSASLEAAAARALGWLHSAGSLER